MRGESDEVEFKSTFRWDRHKKQASSDIEAVVAKTVAGFMNTRGGTLLIGVGDTGAILGIEDDLNTLAAKTPDGMQRSLVELISSHLGPEHVPLVHVDFETIENKQICTVRVDKSSQPVEKRAKGSK